ncbi:MAG: lysine--tRNA ligase [bacterium]|nr:lysine--tRNA ligase [bacterium]
MIQKTLEEIRKTRLQKLKGLETAGVLAYPASTKRTHRIIEALDDFSVLAKSKKEVILAGRIRALRQHGKLTFLNIEDGSAKIQALLKENRLGEKGYAFFLKHFDIGDFVELKGILFETKTKEKTIEVADYKMLAKSLLPLPEKWHGLQDEEEKLRKRYLDILFNPEVKTMVEKKAVFWQSMREFLLARGFLEVETPVFETTPGGADARPFSTHHNALDIDVYLRISMGELWQKRLMVAGLEKTFEIGRQFRNEGIDAEHVQDYTQMEFYWAYADYKDGMNLVEEMYRHVAKKTFGTLKFNIKGVEIDLGKKWERYDYREMVQKYAGVDVLDVGIKEIEAKLKKLNIEYDKEGFNLGRAMDNLWKYCRKKIVGPGFLINVPVTVSPLAKRCDKNPELTQRFQVIMAGSELGNGYSELNNPLEQAERFKEQQKLREAGDEEAQMYDQDFVEALEYGMPPTCGFGVSERFFSFLMGKPIRECQVFPLLKPKQNS